MDKLQRDKILPDEMLADTLYGSDANVVESKKRGVRLISPASGKHPKEPPEHPNTKQKRLALRGEEQKNEESCTTYAIRAGIEGTNSGVKRKTGIGRLRVRGKKSVFYAIFLKTAGWNIMRASKSQKMKTKIAKIFQGITANYKYPPNSWTFVYLNAMLEFFLCQF